MKILIAEDDALSHTLLTRHLEKWDHEVIGTKNGGEALETFQSDEDIQFLLLDWMMPEIDGVEVCRRIKSEHSYRFSYIIMLTAKNQSDDIAQALDLGADEYIVKPFQPVELRARISAGERIVRLHNELQTKLDELTEAYEHVKQLQGIIPICAWCKRIRDDSDFWSNVEDYMSAHSEVKFSHGVCPDCMKEKYPTLDFEK